MSIKNRFEKFTKNIRPSDEHISEANRQANYMIEKLHDKVAIDKTFILEKVLKSGSNAKFTSLKNNSENRFDVDLSGYFSGEGAKKEDLNRLLQFTYDKLIEIYPMKDKADFTILKSTVRVQFRSGIKLWVDLTPIVKDDSLGITNGGYIPREDGWRLTSVTKHNEFVTTRTAQSKNVSGPVRFNRLLRLFKWWNNRLGELTQPSIFCELVAAAAIQDSGVTGEWQTSLRQLFLFMRKHGFKSPIIFSDNYNPRTISIPKDEVIVLDSVNSQNNITYPWTSKTRDAFLDRVQESYDAMMDARSAEADGEEEQAVEHWCEVFGPSFRFLSE